MFASLLFNTWCSCACSRLYIFIRNAPNKYLSSCNLQFKFFYFLLIFDLRIKIRHTIFWILKWNNGYNNNNESWNIDMISITFWINFWWKNKGWIFSMVTNYVFIAVFFARIYDYVIIFRVSKGGEEWNQPYHIHNI